MLIISTLQIQTHLSGYRVGMKQMVSSSFSIKTFIIQYQKLWSLNHNGIVCIFQKTKTTLSNSSHTFKYFCYYESGKSNACLLENLRLNFNIALLMESDEGIIYSTSLPPHIAFKMYQHSNSQSQESCILQRLFY